MIYILGKTSDMQNFSFASEPVQHKEYDVAYDEAKRLVGISKGMKFVVFQALAVAEYATPPVIVRSLL